MRRDGFPKTHACRPQRSTAIQSTRRIRSNGPVPRGIFDDEIGLCVMATNRRNWGGWLLLMVPVLFAATCLWRYSERIGEAARPVDQAMTTHPGVEDPRSALPAPAVMPRPTISADGTAAVPIRFQLANVGRVRTALGACPGCLRKSHRQETALAWGQRRWRISRRLA